MVERSENMKQLAMLLMLTLSCGCGLNDYQEKMITQQKLMKQIDREKELLNPSLDVPLSLIEQRKGATYADVYLRPPQSVDTKPEEKLARDVLMVYPGKENIKMYLAFRGKEKEFVKEVINLVPRTTEVKQSSTQIKHPSGGKAMRLLQYSFQHEAKDKTITNYLLYLTPRGNIAILYQMTGSSVKDKEAVKLSISTLGIGEDAARRKAFYSSS